MNPKPSTSHTRFFPLVCLLLVSAISLIIVVPRLGFDFTDHGYYLYNSFILSHGVIPSVGFSASINSVFMMLGIRQYLFYELLYFGVIVLGLTSLWLVVNKARSLLILFLLIAISITNKTTHILSYQNGVEIYLLFALSFLGLAQNTVYRMPAIAYLLISAFLFAFSSFANISLLPTVLSNAILFFIFFRKQRKLIFFISAYVVISALLFYFYSNSAHSIFHYYGDRQSVMTMIEKIPKLLSYIFIHNKTYFLLIIAAVTVKLYSYRHKNSDCTVHTFFLFSILLMLINQYNSMHLINLTHRISTSGVIWLRLMMVALILYFDFSNKKNRLLTLAGLITFSYACALAITTQSGFIYHLGLLSSSAIVVTALAFITKLDERSSSTLYYRTSFIMLLIVSLTISAYYFIHHSYRARPVIAVKKASFTSGPLAGIRMSTSKYQAFSAIEKFYRRYHCATKLFLAYPALPAIYPLLNHRAPYDQAWISPSVGRIDRKDIATLLQNKTHWCVVIAPEFNLVPSSFTKEAIEFLSGQSRISFSRVINSKWPISERSLYPNKLLFFVR